VAPSNECVLIIAPSGVELGDAVGKLAKKLGAASADIEAEMKRDPKTEESLKKINASFTSPINMETVTHNLPRLKVSDLWNNALARCVKQLKESSKRVKILSGHLVYYSSKRSEFYSVVDFSSLLSENNGGPELRITKILLLVDDIYDMYTRLSELYSPSQVGPLMERMGIPVSESSKETIARVTMTWQTNRLLSLLSWRSVEPIIAENLALRLNSEFLIWPVKQGIDAITIWLKKSPHAVYLSHPIGEPRRQQNSTGKWPSFTTEVNKLQKQFSKHGITLASPTGIDEYRFEEKKASSSTMPRYTGRLNARWPLIEKDSDTLYKRPKMGGSPDYEELLLPRYWDPPTGELWLLKGNYPRELKDEVDANIQLLIAEIESQISSRDFLFVYHTKGLLVYRPYFGKKPKASFSGGVDAEVRLWEDIVQLGIASRIAFVHFEQDVRSMLFAKKDQVGDEFVDQMGTLLKKILKVPRETIKGMVQNQGKVKEVQDILNRSNLAQRDRIKLERAFQANWKTGKVELIRKYLAGGVTVSKELIGIWILESYQALQSELAAIAHFLQTGSPQGNNWEPQVQSLLLDNQIIAKQR